LATPVCSADQQVRAPSGGKRPGQKPGLLFLFHAKPWLNDGNRYYRVFLLAHRILVRWQA
ncbi:MAG: hypothetical protein EBV72_04830, partial [Betaproteobacteria bacterium]|nr:hypothetical protein [Betaproteobacteria bacterium]